VKSGNNAHTFLFVPARWAGKGVLSIIGGPSEPITMEIIASRSGTGTITVHMELDFSQTNREGGVETVYTLSPNGKDSFELVQNHSKLGMLTGHAVVTKRTIIMTFQNEAGTYAGFEAAERIDDDHYHLRGALSLNGMPSSVLEAAVRKLGNQN